MTDLTTTLTDILHAARTEYERGGVAGGLEHHQAVSIARWMEQRRWMSLRDLLGPQS